MQTEWNENRIVLHGRVCQAPVPSHTNHGESYLKFPLAVCRLSGAEDRVNVVASAALLERCPLTEGEELSVEGEVRSFNNRSGVGSRLVISVYARQMHREPGEEENRLRLTGTLCKVPVYRRTPLGRDICDLMLAVNRRYGRTDYLPCIAWGSLARRCAELAPGNRWSWRAASGAGCIPSAWGRPARSGRPLRCRSRCWSGWMPRLRRNSPADERTCL